MHNTIINIYQVLVRVRPFSEKEIADKNDFVVDIINEKSLSVTNVEGKKSFQCSFDAVLGECIMCVVVDSDASKFPC